MHVDMVVCDLYTRTRSVVISLVRYRLAGYYEFYCVSRLFEDLSTIFNEWFFIQVVQSVLVFANCGMLIITVSHVYSRHVLWSNKTIFSYFSHSWHR